MNTSNNWGARSLSYWLVALLSAFLLFLGVNGFIQPEAAIEGFGLPLSHPADASIVRIKADRDFFIGLFIVSLLVLKMRRASLVFMIAAVGMPLADALLVLANAADKSASWIHLATVAYLLIVSWMLYREERNAAKR